MSSPYLSASEAAEWLGISLPTLYAYVSRGMIRSEMTGEDHRTRRYLREDVERLKARKEQRQNPAKAAETALNWGEPVLESAITLIENGRLYYRGVDAIELAQSRSLEAVAEWIWLGEWGRVVFSSDVMRVAKIPERILGEQTLAEKFQIALACAASEDLQAYDLTPMGVARTGARILRLFAQIIAPGIESETGIAETLATGWGLTDPDAVSLINMALVLCADHELNVSAFTARCVASAGATPYGVVIAGLAALQGYKHGGATGQVAAFFREAGSPDGARMTIASRIRRGETIPGFGHKLYPHGDPRGALLVERASRHFPDAPAVRLGQAIIAEMAALNGLRPTVDFGLVMLAGALGLPFGSALALFALGRTVGWIGQAIEQYDLDSLIRPRARYTGVIPRK